MIKKILKRLSSREKGNFGEILVEEYLVSNGFEILSKNYKTKIGEIDLIAKKGDLLIFVEVKSDFKEHELICEEKVNLKKKRKILTVAEQFLIKNSQFLSKIKEIRFDVVVVKKGRIVHYENAFTQDG